MQDGMVRACTCSYTYIAAALEQHSYKSAHCKRTRACSALTLEAIPCDVAACPAGLVEQLLLC